MSGVLNNRHYCPVHISTKCLPLNRQKSIRLTCTRTPVYTKTPCEMRLDAVSHFLQTITCSISRTSVRVICLTKTRIGTYTHTHAQCSAIWTNRVQIPGIKNRSSKSLVQQTFRVALGRSERVFNQA